MWRRQLSTFDRSSKSGSRICVVVSLMASPGSRWYRRTLPSFVRPTFCKGTRSGTAYGRSRGEATKELLQACLEHATLRLDVGAELVDLPTHLHFQLTEPHVVRRDELVVPALELLGDVRDAMLEPLGAGISHVREPLCEHRLRLA